MNRGSYMRAQGNDTLNEQEDQCIHSKQVSMPRSKFSQATRTERRLDITRIAGLPSVGKTGLGCVPTMFT